MQVTRALSPLPGAMLHVSREWSDRAHTKVTDVTLEEVEPDCCFAPGGCNKIILKLLFVSSNNPQLSLHVQ